MPAAKSFNLGNHKKSGFLIEVDVPQALKEAFLTTDEDLKKSDGQKECYEIRRKVSRSPLLPFLSNGHDQSSLGRD